MTKYDWKNPQPTFTGLSLVREHFSVKGCSTGEKKSDVYGTVEGYLSNSYISHNRMMGMAVSIAFKVFNSQSYVALL